MRPNGRRWRKIEPANDTGRHPSAGRMAPMPNQTNRQMKMIEQCAAAAFLVCLAAGCANSGVSIPTDAAPVGENRQTEQGPQSTAAELAAKQERYRQRLREYEERKARERAERIEAARRKELAIQEEYRRRIRGERGAEAAQPEIADRGRGNSNDKSILFAGMVPDVPKRVVLSGTAYERESALKALPATENQSVFADVALHDPFGRVRFAAVERLRDDDALAAIATSGDEPYIRAEAARKVKNRSVLAKLADDPSEIVRRAAREALGQ